MTLTNTSLAPPLSWRTLAALSEMFTVDCGSILLWWMVLGETELYVDFFLSVLQPSPSIAGPRLHLRVELRDLLVHGFTCGYAV